MELIKKGTNAYFFRCVKGFNTGERTVSPGEEVELKEPDASGLVQRGKVLPSDLPTEDEYIALQPFSLPGRVEKFMCERLEKVQIRAEDAVDLMLRGFIIPSDDRWRPFGRKLKTRSATPGR